MIMWLSSNDGHPSECVRMRVGANSLVFFFFFPPQRSLSFFPSSRSFTILWWNVHLNVESTPSRDLFKPKNQIRIVRRRPQNAHFHLPSIQLNLSRVTPVWTSSLAAGSRLICVWIASITGDFHALSSEYQSISGSAALMSSIFGTRQLFIWSSFYTRILIRPALLWSGWDQEQRFLPPSGSGCCAVHLIKLNAQILESCSVLHWQIYFTTLKMCTYIHTRRSIDNMKQALKLAIGKTTVLAQPRFSL